MGNFGRLSFADWNIGNTLLVLNVSKEVLRHALTNVSRDFHSVYQLM